MHIVIGYLQLHPGVEDASEQVAHMRALGADVVRVEDEVGGAGLLKPMLRAICDFIGPGDELITPDFRHLGESAGAVLEVARRLKARGAHLRLLEPDASTAEASGQALIRALEQLSPGSPVRPAERGRKPSRKIDPREVQALRAHGFGPSQIAQKLGVSRMTVWRKLAAQEPGHQTAMGADG